jgi:hypothetical protein
MRDIEVALAKQRNAIISIRHKEGRMYAALHLREAENAISQALIQLKYATLAQEEGR